MFKSFEEKNVPPRDFYTQEPERGERKLDFEKIKESHEGISDKTKKELNELFARLHDVQTGEIENKNNLLHITQSRIQNVIVREILEQEKGPVSLSRSDFEQSISVELSEQSERHTYDAQTSKEFFDESWKGIQTAARAAQIELEKKDGWQDKAIVFNDEIDANDATDFLVFGRLPDKSEAGSFLYKLKLVQVGTRLKYKKPEHVYQNHVQLAERLINKASFPQTFEQARNHIEDFILTLVEDIETSDDKLVASNKDSVRHFGWRSIVRSSVLNFEDISESVEGVEDVQDFISDDDYKRFKYNLYLLQILQEESSGGENVVENLIDTLFEETSWIASMPTGEKNHYKETLLTVLSTFIADIQEANWKEAIPYEISSKIMARFAGDQERAIQERPINIDNKVTAVYRLRRSEVLKALKRSLSWAHEDK